jgi:S-adenosylmethionine hydrolase
VDSFGNLITNIRSERLSGKGQSVTIVVGEHRVRGLVRTYAEGEGLMALAGSSGYLEVSLKNRDAANFLRAQAGDEIKVEFAG